MSGSLRPPRPPRDTRSPTFLRLVRPYVRRRISRELDGLWVSGLEPLRARLAGGPLLLAPTHVSWWDAFLLVALDEALGAEGWCLMDADNLARLPFFGWIGALPLDRTGGGRARRGLEFAAAKLSGPGKALWVFPQGRQRPAHLRPLGLEPGVRLLQRLTQAPVVPISLNYLFREGERPAAFAAIGRPVEGDLLPGLEASLVQGLDAIDRFVDRGQGDFLPLVAPHGARSEAGRGARLLRQLGGATPERDPAGAGP